MAEILLFQWLYHVTKFQGVIGKNGSCPWCWASALPHRKLLPTWHHYHHPVIKHWLFQSRSKTAKTVFKRNSFSVLYIVYSYKTGWFTALFSAQDSKTGFSVLGYNIAWCLIFYASYKKKKNIAWTSLTRCIKNNQYLLWMAALPVVTQTCGMNLLH